MKIFKNGIEAKWVLLIIVIVATIGYVSALTPIVISDATSTFGGLNVTRINATGTGNNYFAGNVGIGTANPGVYKLKVDGGAAHTTVMITSNDGTSYIPALGLWASDISKGWSLAFDQTDSDKFKIWDTSSSNTRLTIDGSGNVGIGTTAPETKLHVVGAEGTNNNEFRVLEVSAITDETKGIVMAYNTTYDAGIIASIDSGTAWKNVIINPVAGNVGIGTTGPQTLLHLRSTSANSPRVRLDGIGDVNWWGYEFTDDGTEKGGMFMLDDDDRLALWTSLGEAVTLLQSGNVGIGTTNPTYQLQTTGTVSFSGLSAATPDSDWAICRNPTTKEIKVNTGLTSCASSSEKVKHNIETITTENLPDNFMKVRPIKFVYNSDKTGREKVGFSAEELALIYPEVVATNYQGSGTFVKFIVDSTNPNKASGALYSDGVVGEIVGVNYEFYTAILTSKLQEQTIVNINQQNDINTLKYEVELLKGNKAAVAPTLIPTTPQEVTTPWWKFW